MIHKHRDVRLFYVVGPSGSGKDSILRYFRQHMIHTGEHPVSVAHRYITRPADNNENSIALSDEEFKLRQQKQLFIMQWQANGFYYGIGNEVDLWLNAGVSVIVNGSRAYLPEACKRFGNKLHSIQIIVSDDVLEQRLRQRNRESEGEIQLRLQRHRRLQPQYETDSVIVNDTSIEQAANRLLSITQHISSKH